MGGVGVPYKDNTCPKEMILEMSLDMDMRDMWTWTCRRI